MKRWLIILLLPLYSISIAQQTIGNTTVYTNYYGQKVTEIGVQRGQRKYPSTYRGSLFYNDTLQPARFSLAGGNWIESPAIFIPLKNLLYISLNGKILAIKPDNFYMDNKEFVLIKRKYYELLFTGEVKILKQYIQQFIQKREKYDPTKLYNYVGSITKESYFYFLFPDNTLREFEINKKSVLQVLTKYMPELLTGINQDSLTIKTIDDVQYKILFRQ